MLTRPSIGRRTNFHRASGFTLVEMMVAVTLVLIMMAMFAKVFVMATDSLSQQRAIAENDQRGRLITTTIRNDLDERTFRDLLPFRANEDTRQLGNSLSRRAGYFEIDEGDPNDDTDDCLTFTAFVNIRLQNKDASPFAGTAQTMSLVGSTANGTAVTASVVGSTGTFNFADSGYYLNKIAVGSRIWVAGTPNVPYTVTSVGPTSASNSNTNVTVSTTLASTGSVNVYLSENDPDFDDGVFGNLTSVSALAEVCYFLRNGVLYRRVLLIRDTPAGTDAQPTYSTGVPILWNGSAENYALASTTFWRDFDYSAFYYTGTGSGNSEQGVRFHNAAESLSNSNQGSQILTNYSIMKSNSFPFSLGIPHYRFGHSTTNGLPQDASTTAFVNGTQISIGRFNLQECSNTSFGYPGYIPASGNPFDTQNIVVDPATGLVQGLEGQSFRRGQDILLTNVLSFDVKVWDAYKNNNQFVDIGNSTSKFGPFSSAAGVFTDTGNANGNIVGGRLNSTYGPDTSQSSLNHYRFDTWHPNASITTLNLPTPTTYPTTPVFYNEPPYYNFSTTPPPPYTYNEPPYVPVVLNPTTGLNQAAPLTAIQITINYRDISSNEIRQVTIIQSLVDRVKQTTLTNEGPEE